MMGNRGDRMEWRDFTLILEEIGFDVRLGGWWTGKESIIGCSAFYISFDRVRTLNGFIELYNKDKRFTIIRLNSIKDVVISHKKPVASLKIIEENPFKVDLEGKSFNKELMSKCLVKYFRGF